MIESLLEFVLNGIESIIRSILKLEMFRRPRAESRHVFIHIFLFPSQPYKLVAPARCDRDGLLVHNNCLKTWISFGLMYKK